MNSCCMVEIKSITGSKIKGFYSFQWIYQNKGLRQLKLKDFLYPTEAVFLLNTIGLECIYSTEITNYNDNVGLHITFFCFSFY